MGVAANWHTGSKLLTGVELGRLSASLMTKAGAASSSVVPSGAERGAAARPVLDHHVRAMRKHNLLPQQTGQDVRAVAGRIGHDDLDALHRLRPCALSRQCGQSCRQARCGCNPAKLHPGILPMSLLFFVGGPA
jgi:hypothetical protein